MRFSREPTVAGIFSTLVCARAIFVRFVVYVCLFINLFIAIFFFVSLLFIFFEMLLALESGPPLVAVGILFFRNWHTNYR